MTPTLDEDRESPVAVAAAALAVLAVFALFRQDAIQRIQAVFIADSSEYLMLAQGMLTEGRVPVRSLRLPFFSLFLAVPLWIRDQVVGADAPYDSSVARIVPVLFHLLACAGAWRLGRMAAGLGAAFLGALVIAVLPEFGYWSTDYLTDGPAGACILWAVVFLVQERLVLTGLWLGLAVLLRYQSLMTLVVVLALPLLARRPRDYRPLLLGGLGPIALLGLLDWWTWGTPFASLWNFWHQQKVGFVPVEVQSQLPTDLPGAQSPGMTWYLAHAFETFTWPLAVAFLLLPLARWRLRHWRIADLGAYVALGTVFLLSMQRFKESRYLLAVMPLVGTLGAITVVAFGSALVARLPLLEPGRGGRTGRAILLALLAALFVDLCWREQAARPYDRFGSIVRAVDSIPDEEKPYTIYTWRPWLLTPQHPILSAEARGWQAADIRIVSDGQELTAYASRIDEPGRLEAFDGFVARLDYILAHDMAARPANDLWRVLDRRFAVVDAFWERSWPRDPVYLLRQRAAAGEGGPGFWSIAPEGIEVPNPAVRFGRALELIALTAREMPSAPEVVRLDTVWRLDAGRLPACLVEVDCLRPAGAPGFALLGEDRYRLASPRDEPRAQVITMYRYVALPDRAPGADLRLRVHVRGAEGERIPASLRATVGKATLLDSGGLELSIRVERSTPLPE